MNSDDVTSVLSSWERADRSSGGGALHRRLADLLEGDHNQARWMIDMTGDLLGHLWSAGALTVRVRELSSGRAAGAPSLGTCVAVVAAALRDCASSWPTGTDAAWHRACNLIDQATHPDQTTPFLPAPSPNDITTGSALDRRGR